MAVRIQNTGKTTFLLNVIDYLSPKKNSRILLQVDRDVSQGYRRKKYMRRSLLLQIAKIG